MSIRSGASSERTLVEHSTSSLPDLVRALVEAMIEAHTTDPELFELLRWKCRTELTRARDFESRLRGVLRLALTSRARKSARVATLERVLFVLTHMVDSLSHAAAIQRPSKLLARRRQGRGGTRRTRVSKGVSGSSRDLAHLRRRAALASAGAP